MKRTIMVALALFVVIAGGLAALAMGGSSGDPLISLSYLTDTYLPGITNQALQRADQGLEQDYQAALGRLEEKQAGFFARAQVLSGDWNYFDLFERQGYKRNDLVKFTSGSGFLFLAGSATAAALQGGELVDITAGTSAPVTDLTPGHRYLAAEDTLVTITVVSDTAFLAPQGYCAAQPSQETTLPFTDLVSTAWYYENVRYTCQAGLFQGVEENLFSPSSSMTRAMLATVLHRLAGSPELPLPDAPSFRDVASDSWYTKPVHWAASSGIVTGVGDGLYMPNSNVTREQMAVMLFRYAKEYVGLAVPATGNLSVFLDAGQASPWAEEALRWAVGAGILGGRTNGTLDPRGTASRAEVAAMLQRFSGVLT